MTEAEARAVLREQAASELAKLGVRWEVPLEERAYDALLTLPPKIGRPCTRMDLASELGVTPASLKDPLQRLREQGRALNPVRGVWVAKT